jgi:hypothetical protein
MCFNPGKLFDSNQYVFWQQKTKCFLKNAFFILFFLGISNYLFAQNSIATENALAGNPSSEWEIIGAGDPTIQGFATQMSVNKGSTINFKIDITGTDKNFSIKIYRIGYYQGNGARLISDQGTYTGVAQPAPSIDPVLGLVDCDNWAQSASWDVPANAVSGVYIAKLTREDNGGSSHIIFIVRDDASTANILFKTSDATWQGYNTYGGYSFYEGTTANTLGRADKISYNRPFSSRNNSPQNYFFNAEYPMIRWLERNGYDLTYTTDVDMERNATTITPSIHKVLMSVGHDEYWSANERNTFENARNSGVNLAFFSGNEVYWKVRYENNERTLVCYKEGNSNQGEFTCGGNCDPLAGVWTGLWRFGCEYGEDGCKPENELSGQISWTESQTPILVPSEYKDLSFWRNTSIASLTPGQTATLGDNTLGYEWNFEQPLFANSNPPGRITLSSTTVGDKTHKLSLYTHSSGALVFGAGTVQWSWGLDNVHDGLQSTISLDMQQATLNLLVDMGVTPSTIQSDLILSASSHETTPPISTISAPVNGSSRPANVSLNITGTASDASGVFRVEVSVDGGNTWEQATGTTNWSFTYNPVANGPLTILSRAIDNAGNAESIGTVPSSNAVSITLTGTVGFFCPCKIFPNSTFPVITNQQDNTTGIVVGTRFRASVDGTISAMRFYKGAGNTGTHIGQLWTTSGTLLGEATYTNETTFGWQQVSLPAPVPITAGTDYIVSYFSSDGFYAVSNNFFVNSVVNGPLTSPADANGASNGVYKYSTVPDFPDQTFNRQNYFVDVIFNVASGSGSLPVSFREFRLSSLQNNVTLYWTTASESRNSGFEIQRSMDGVKWLKIGFVNGAGNSQTQQKYQYNDNYLNEGRYFYRLKQIDIDGQYKFYNVISVNISGKKGFMLGQNYPNPAKNTTTISISIPERAPVEMALYDMQGRQMKVLINEIKEAGTYTIGLDLSKLNKGVYYYKMKSGNFSDVKKLLVD